MNLNKCFVLGNLTKDPELRQTNSGQSVCSFSVASNRTWNDKNGDKQQEVEFHNVVAWGRTGELVSQYMRKGSQILVEGRLQTRSWEGKNGTQYKTEIVAETVQFGNKPRNDYGPKVDEPAPDEGATISTEEVPF